MGYREPYSGKGEPIDLTKVTPPQSPSVAQPMTYQESIVDSIARKVIEKVADQVQITVTPLDPTKCYFIILHQTDGDGVMYGSEAIKILAEKLRAHDIRCVVAMLPNTIEVECIEQEAPPMGKQD